MVWYTLLPGLAHGVDFGKINIKYKDKSLDSFSVRDNPYKYSGYYCDYESGMYYCQARYYSPELMRFINRDTYDLSNRYAYCDGDPVNNIDPNGHMSTQSAIGVVVNSILAAISVFSTIFSIVSCGALTVTAVLAYIGDGFNLVGDGLSIAAPFVEGKNQKVANYLNYASYGCAGMSLVLAGISSAGGGARKITNRGGYNPIPEPPQAIADSSEGGAAPCPAADSEESCSICLGPLGVESDCVTTNCGHKFHSNLWTTGEKELLLEV